MKYKVKDRMALVSKKNMKEIMDYYNVKDHKNFDLTKEVNYLIGVAIGEFKAIDEKIEEEERELKELLNETEKEIERLKE